MINECNIADKAFEGTEDTLKDDRVEPVIAADEVTANVDHQEVSLDENDNREREICSLIFTYERRTQKSIMVEVPLSIQTIIDLCPCIYNPTI